MSEITQKERIKKVMLDHLATVGFGPNNNNPQIVLDNLRAMWVKLEEAGLIQPGMTFPGFAAQAQQAFTMHQLRDFFNI